MEEKKSGKVAFQPYARLISILGDQLISDKWVGIIEIIKNSYDADAEEVDLTFENFKNTREESTDGVIEIRDDGVGMDLTTILDVWMKPATPNKLNKKKSNDTLLRRTEKGRVMQGDKGVGRFAVYKLGDYVEVFTKKKDDKEIKLTLDFTNYADDNFKESDHKDVFLSDILNDWVINEEPEEITNNKKQGTLIRISTPRNNWKKSDLKKLSKAFFRMMPPELPNLSITKDFDVSIFWDLQKYETNLLDFEEMSEMAPFYFEGSIDQNGFLDARYVHNKREKSIKFDLLKVAKEQIKYDIKKLKFFKETFLTKDGNEIVKRPNVGEFMFFFYGYDLKNPSESLTKIEKDYLKETSVYLYRDNIRVYPYGEIGDDWLQLSKYRAEDRAGNYFSYNDLIGFIFITQDENQVLRDAADREGLMNTDGAKDQFVALIQAALKVMKDEVTVDKKKKELSNSTTVKNIDDSFQNSFEKFKRQILKVDDKDLLNSSQKFFENAKSYVSQIREELTITQDLAGTGMVVEKATHDTMSLLLRLKENTGDFIKRFKKNDIDKTEFETFLNYLKENVDFLYQELQVLQPLFRRARKVTKDVSVRETTLRISKYFRKELKENIEFSIVSGDTDIIVMTNTGLILQVILNLMDNSIYWLNQQNEPKKIHLSLNEEDGILIFADSGIGIDDSYKDIIFKEFYSSKSEGRGLGLYIVRELLDRIDSTIELVNDPEEKILKGANFKITFNRK